MRVLHLLPLPGSSWAQRVASLCDELHQLDPEHAVWTAPPDCPEDVGLYQALRRGDVELIHNHRGWLPLTWAAQSEIPVLTSCYCPPLEAELVTLSQGTPPRVVWADRKSQLDAATRDAFDCIATEPTSDPKTLAIWYRELYPDFAERETKRRIDTTGDTRPWGSYWVLDDQQDCKVKRIRVLPGKRLSYQRHQKRTEHWIITHGQAKVTLDGEERSLSPGDSVVIEIGMAHRIENVGSDDVVLVEVQLGSYFGEDDIERLEDDFGRVQ